MTNESAFNTECGIHRFRSMRRGGRVSSLALGLALWVCASAAMAAEIVEVRVGRHPTFTRVVFELDRATGYRIERARTSDGGSELVVSLEATSIPRSVKPSKTLIEQVNVTPSGRRSVARIALAKDGLKLKEMILSSPPRIVLDVHSDKPVVTKTASTASKRTASKAAVAKPKAAKPSVKKASTSTPSSPSSSASSAAKSAAKPVEKTPVTPTRQAAPQSDADRHIAQYVKKSNDAQADAATDAAKTASKVASAASDTATKAASAVADTAVDLADTATSKADAAASSVADAASGAADTASDSFDNLDNDALRAEVLGALADGPAEVADAASGAASDAPDALAGAANAASDQAQAAAGESPKVPFGGANADNGSAPKPMVAKTTSDEGGGMMTWALAGAGAIALVAGGLFMARRRSGGDVEYADSDEGDPFGVDGGANGSGNVEADVLDDAPVDRADNPFANVENDGEQLNLGDANASTENEMPMSVGDDAASALTSQDSDEEKESESVVFEDSEEEAMEVISRDAVNESLGMPPTAGAIPEEFQQMMREMAGRVAALEGRCDELVDARDRLERQVAAQTEELRVQRAAIARTQRAVRNLARPEDEESEATEPAFRDPNQPSSQD